MNNLNLVFDRKNGHFIVSKAVEMTENVLRIIINKTTKRFLILNILDGWDKPFDCLSCILIIMQRLLNRLDSR
jgi:hypothetical protein